MGFEQGKSTWLAVVTLVAVLTTGVVAFLNGLEAWERVSCFLYLEGTGLMGLAVLRLIAHLVTEPVQLERLLFRLERKLFLRLCKHPAFLSGLVCLVAGDLINLA